MTAGDTTGLRRISMATLTSNQPVARAKNAIVQRLVATHHDYGALAARLALGLVIFPHGAQKALGWFGGHGFNGTMGFFTQTMGIPAPFALLAIAAEFLGALGLIFGVLGRLSAFGVGFTMLVAAVTVHLPNGFFMNWMGTQKGEGIEFFVLAIGLAVTVMIKGSGALSVDRALTKPEA
jgi:putative oxidoreductase